MIRLLMVLIFLPMDGAVMFLGMTAGLVYGSAQWVEQRLSRFIYVQRLKHSNL